MHFSSFHLLHPAGQEDDEDGEEDPDSLIPSLTMGDPVRWGGKRK
jgi:hypothetical protein